MEVLTISHMLKKKADFFFISSKWPNTHKACIYFIFIHLLNRDLQCTGVSSNRQTQYSHRLFGTTSKFWFQSKEFGKTEKKGDTPIWMI